jgi:hypothetical protein
VVSGNGQFKPWYRESFRAPSDLQQREALWGPVVDTWMTPEESECKEFGSGAVLCDNPHGVTFAHINEDHVMWLQYPDGSKEWLIPPSNVPRS